MGLQLMKLLVTATTITDVVPTVEKFFYVTEDRIDAGDTLTIDTADFFNDSGGTPAALPALVTDNSYYKVYINGVLQMEDITNYTAGATTVGSLVINVPAGVDAILKDTPIVLEVVNYAPSSNTTVET